MTQLGGGVGGPTVIREKTQTYNLLLALNG